MPSSREFAMKQSHYFVRLRTYMFAFFIEISRSVYNKSSLKGQYKQLCLAKRTIVYQIFEAGGLNEMQSMVRLQNTKTVIHNHLLKGKCDENSSKRNN